MAGQPQPSVEWIATTAAAIYTVQFEHFVRTSKDGDSMEGSQAMSDAVEMAHLLWTEAAKSFGAPPEPRMRRL